MGLEQQRLNGQGFHLHHDWDEHDRLTRIELPNSERWRYRYDAFGRRVAKACEQGAQASHQVHYLYDGAQVIQQTLKTANGEALQSTEYIYEPGSFRPVAQVDTNHTLAIEKLHYVVTDHAGTPRELCAEDGDIVWRGEQGLWHRHTQTLQSNVKRLFEDAANDRVHCDLRYQGQLEDKESGLYYNLNRYYDADSGQYLSSDPIGMLGGLRPQAYVHNPMEWVDPLGLTGHSVVKGGRHRHTKKNGKKEGTQSHHPIADDVSDIATNDALAIRMETDDHIYRTGNWGSRKKSIKFRAKQQALVEQGKYDEALKMGIDDIRIQNGSKYDKHIEDMLYSAPKKADGTIDWSKFKRKN